MNPPRASFRTGNDGGERLPQLQSITFSPRHRRNPDATFALSVPALFRSTSRSSLDVNVTEVDIEQFGDEAEVDEAREIVLVGSGEVRWS